MGKPTKPSLDVVPVTSSSPAVLPKEQAELFRDVLSWFEKSGKPYAVAGAFALRQHTGICRYTKDLDIFLSTENATEALACLQRHGFEVEVCDPIWLAKARRGEFFVDLITGMSNGVISVDLSWIERAIPANVLDIDSRVLAIEELIVSKLFVTRRERFDGGDIAHLVYAARGHVNWDRVMELTGEHWEVLLWNLMLFHYVYPAHADFVPKALWEDLMARFANEVRSPDPKAKFRGSLIDNAIFAIDVEEWGLDDVLSESRARRAQIQPPVRRSA